MAKTTFSTGTDPNDGTGSPLRTAFNAIIANEDELYEGANITATAPIQKASVADTSITISLADTGVTSGKLATDSVITAKILNDNVTHDKLEGRYTDAVSITTLTGTVSFNCESASVFKLSGDLTGAYTISLTDYKKAQIITIYPLKGNQTLNLAGQGSSTNTFNKIGGVDYDDDGSASNIIQIECVDDSATDPIFFYSLATFAEDSSDI